MTDKKIIKDLTSLGVSKRYEGLSDTITKDEVEKKFNEAGDKLSEAIEKIKKIDTTLYAVVLVLLFMVAGLLMDAFHFNSAVYKEYSEKTESVETTQKANELLLKQIQDLTEQNVLLLDKLSNK